MLLIRPLTVVVPALLLVAHLSTVEPFLIITPSTATTTTATGTATTGTVGTLGTLGTLTLGTTTLGTGLASLGVLGALKLGVIAIAAKLAALAGFAIAKKLHYKEPQSEYNSYSHHYVPVYTSGYGGYGGGGYGGGHYHKRSIPDEEDLDVKQPLVMSEEEAFSLVHEYDQSKCGERLICELATRSRYGLLSDEESLLSLIKRKPTGSSYGSQSFRSLYLSAMKSGYRRKPCRRLYPTCPFNSYQIMALVRSMGRELVQDPVSFLASRPDEQTLHPGKTLTEPGSPYIRNLKQDGADPRTRVFGAQKISRVGSSSKTSVSTHNRPSPGPMFGHIGYRKS